MKITLLHPQSFKLDGGAMFGIIPKPLWEKKIIPDDHNRIAMSLRMVLIEQEVLGVHKKILIDTAIGFHHDEKFQERFAITAPYNSFADFFLHELGFSPESITDIIATHLHFDHIGGLGWCEHLPNSENKLHFNFPNAHLWLHQDHYHYAQHPTIRDSGSFHSHHFNPLLDELKKQQRLHLLTGGDHLQDIPELGVKFLTSYGHTPAMIHPVFHHFIYMADLVPMLHHVKLPWVMGYDIAPGVTTQYKEQFYQTILKHQLTMIFEHDQDSWGCDLEASDHIKLSHRLSPQNLTKVLL